MALSLPPELELSNSDFYDSSGRPSLYSPASKDSNNAETMQIVRQVTKELIIERRKSGLPIGNIPEPRSPAHQEGHEEGEHEGERDHETGALKKPFIKSEGLSTAVADELLKKFGRNELEEKNTPKWLIFCQQLWQPMPLMIWLAIIVEGAIESWPDFGILLGIQLLNASLSYYETTKAGDAVAALKASLKPRAHVKRDGQFTTIDAALLVPGDLVLLGSGGAVPADCLINHGTVDVDQAALTGESLPVTMYEGDAAKMGSTIVRGEVEATVDATGSNTFFGKTASLLSGPEEVSNLQKMLIKIMFVLVVISLTFCITAFIYLMVEGEGFRSALSFTVVLLVASIPVAIEIVCTTTLALGSRQLSTDGAIVSRLAAIEDMAGMNILCSDKTGTLTLNKMVIQEETPVFTKGETQYSLLRFAAMAAKWKEPPRDALDTLVLGSYDKASMDDVVQTEYMPFDPTVKRTEGTIKLNSTGEVFKTTKGAPHIILKLIKDKHVVERCETEVTALGERGIRSLAVAKTDSRGEWQLLGLLTFLDPPRPDTKHTIDTAKTYGVSVKMITGDHLLIAKETARQLGMGTNIKDTTRLPMLEKDGKTPENLLDYLPEILPADGFAGVFPEHKFLIVETLRRGGYKTGMTGDGVNDAPALKRADVGVAVQGATDAARAAADIVLTKPGLSTIVTAIVIARIVFGRMKNFITYRIAATLQLLMFFFVAVLALHPEDFLPANHQSLPGWTDTAAWPRFFHMPVLMLMLITLLNDGTLICIGYDRVVPSQLPDHWNLRVLFTVASALGAVACISSLLMLLVALDSWNPNGFWQTGLGLSGLSYGQITTMVYLKVSVSDFLTLFSARSHNGFFWANPPSLILLLGFGIACSLSTILANIWPESYPDEIYTLGMALHTPKELSLYVWIYCIICWFIQDTVKVVTYWVLRRWNIFGINDTRATTSAEHHGHHHKAAGAKADGDHASAINPAHAV